MEPRPMEILITLIVVVIAMGVTALTVLVSVAVPVAILIVVARRLSQGGTVVVSGPLVDALAQQQPAPGRLGSLVKRTRCPSCGAPKVRPSATAYVYCDYCGLLVDWDFQVAIADKRSKLPGPAYEALVRRLKPSLDAARAAGDTGAYREAQAQIYDGYANACPAACPPRIGDSAYRRRWVQWTAESQTQADLDPTVARATEVMTAKVGALRWDRSNPFQPRAESSSFRELLGAVVAQQQASAHLLEQSGLLATHPDPVSLDLMRRMGLSAMVQGWMTYLPPAEVEHMLDTTGLRDEYDQVRPVTTLAGRCPRCSAPVVAVQGAMRVLCEHCGHMVGVSGGNLPCHGCGATIDLPQDAERFSCPHCDALVQRMLTG